MLFDNNDIDIIMTFVNKHINLWCITSVKFEWYANVLVNNAEKIKKRK